MVYPVGPRRWSRRWLFSLTALAGASLVTMGVLKHPELENEDVAADAVATADVVTPNPVPLPPAASSTASSSNQPLMSNALELGDAQQKAPFLELGAMDSAPGESFDDYIVRVAQAMDAFTKQTNHEVCGVILVNEQGDAWRVRLTTNRSHISCVMVTFDEPGYKRLGPDIHSHPRVPGGIAANSQDIERNPRFACGQTMVVFDETFSEKDLSRGPGYLVSRNRLLFQRGKEFPFQQRAVFDSLERMPELTLVSGEVASFEASAVSLDEGHAAAVSVLAAAWQNQDVEGLPQTSCPPASDVSEEALVIDVSQSSDLQVEPPVQQASRPRMR